MYKFLLQPSAKVQFRRRLDDSANLSNLQNNRSVKQKTNDVVGVAVVVIIIIKTDFYSAVVLGYRGAE